MRARGLGVMFSGSALVAEVVRRERVSESECDDVVIIASMLSSSSECEHRSAMLGARYRRPRAG